MRHPARAVEGLRRSFEAVRRSARQACPTTGYRLVAAQSRVALEASTDVAGGLGFEAKLRIAELSRGALVLSATPFFLAGSGGTAWAVPLTLAYRFQ